MRSVLHALVALLAPSVLPSIASAQVALPMTRAEDGQIRVDGSLREWRGVRFLDVGEGNDASMRVALAFDDAGLFVGAEVRDDRFIRTAHPGQDEDAVIVTLAMPQGRGFAGTDVWLWAGQSGTSPAAIGFGDAGRRPGGARSGAQIVEGPRSSGSGYVVEAFVPWRAIPGAQRWQEGRGTVRLRDVDQAAHPEVEAEPAIAPLDVAHLDRLPALQPNVGSSATLDTFLAQHGLEGARPAHDLRGDVGADPRPERVSFVDRFVVVTGEGWQGGQGFAFLQLPVQSAADVLRPELVDLTGDGKSEIVVTVRQRDERGARDVWQVMGVSGEALRPMFAIETRKETGQGSVEASVRVTRGRRGQAATIEARVGSARGLDASSLQEAPAADAEPILVPWGPARARRYRWDGSTFARIEETPNPDYVDPAAQRAAASSSAGSATAAATAPAAPGVADLLAAFRRERGIPERARPTFRAQANVAASAEPEEVQVYGRDLVVVGPAFRGGTGWFHFEIPAREAGDVIEVRTAEVTGDARQEILVRVRQRIGEVRREVLLVYQFTPVGFPCLLQRELVREEGANRIENELVAGNGRLELRPGTARGWSAASYRYPDTTGPDGVEPPLLPWRDAAITYRFAGGRLVR